MTEPKVTKTANPDGSTTLSMKLSDMSVDQLVAASQTVGKQIDTLREQRKHLADLIATKLDAQRRAGVQAQIERLQADVDGDAPGAVIEASAQS